MPSSLLDFLLFAVLLSLYTSPYIFNVFYTCSNWTCRYALLYAPVEFLGCAVRLALFPGLRPDFRKIGLSAR